MIEIMIVMSMIGIVIASVVMSRTEQEALCLPTGRDGLATDEEILNAMNEAAETMEITSTSAGGLPWVLDWVKTFQNNAHHLEGWLYNHIILMLVVLKGYRDKLSDESYAILERAIFWSDLGKYQTTEVRYRKKKDEFVLDEDGNKIPMKTWDDGTPMSSAIGHDKESAELLDKAVVAMKMEMLSTEDALYKMASTRGFRRAVRWLVANHMKAHQMMEFINAGLNDKGKFSKKVGDFRVIPDFLGHLVDVDAWDWPEYDTFDVSIQNQLNKQTYQWMNLWHSDLLRIKQDCDSKGRISDLDF